jgi:AsnC-like helix-turn-helix protein
MVAAFVLIQIAAAGSWADASAIHSALHAVPGVKTVHFVAGPTDVIAFVEVADQKAFTDTLGKIHAVKGVGSTDSRIVLPV